MGGPKFQSLSYFFLPLIYWEPWQFHFVSFDTLCTLNMLFVCLSVVGVVCIATTKAKGRMVSRKFQGRELHSRSCYRFPFWVVVRFIKAQ